MPTVIATKKDWETFLAHINVVTETCEVQMTEHKMSVNEPGWGNIAMVESECMAQIKDPKSVTLEPDKMMKALSMISSNDIIVTWDGGTITVIGENQYVKMIVPDYEPPKRKTPKINAFCAEFPINMADIRHIMDTAAKMMHATVYSGILFTLQCSKDHGAKMSIGNISVSKYESEHLICSPDKIKWSTEDESCRSQYGASLRKMMEFGQATIFLGHEYPIKIKVDVENVKTTYTLAYTREDDEIGAIRGVKQK